MALALYIRQRKRLADLRSGAMSRRELELRSQGPGGNQGQPPPGPPLAMAYGQPPPPPPPPQLAAQPPAGGYHVHVPVVIGASGSQLPPPPYEAPPPPYGAQQPSAYVHVGVAGAPPPPVYGAQAGHEGVKGSGAGFR